MTFRSAQAPLRILVVGALIAALGNPGPLGAKTTWTGTIPNPMPSQDNAFWLVHAVDGEHAWVVGKESPSGNDQIVGYRSTDGVSWQPMSLPQGSSFFPVIITAIVFTGPDHGFLAGTEIEGLSETHKLYETQNGGQSWNPVTTVGGSIVSFQRLPSGELFGAGPGVFVASTDQGATWSEAAPPEPAPDVAPAAVAMLNATCGWLVGGLPADPEGGRPNASAGAVWYTADGGATWQVRAENLPYYLRAASFVAGDTGWAVGQQDGSRGVLLQTRDGGATFTEVPVPDHPPVPDACIMGQCITDPTPVSDLGYVKFWDASRGVVTGLACTGGCDPGDQPTHLTVVLRSYDGGATWSYDEDYEAAMPDIDMQFLQVPGVLTGMQATSFADPNHGFLAGQYQMILRYDADWIEDPEQAPPACDSSASGDGGVVVRPDGGASGGDGSVGPGADALSGCGCRASAADGAPALVLWLLLVFWGAWRRRRPSPRPRRGRA